MDRQRRGADKEETRSAVLDTALAHHLVSKYTSLIAVDKTPARPATAQLGHEQVPSLLPYGQNSQAIFGFPATATNAAVYRMNGLIILLAALLLFLIVALRSSARVAAPAR